MILSLCTAEPGSHPSLYNSKAHAFPPAPYELTAITAALFFWGLWEASVWISIVIIGFHIYSNSKMQREWQIHPKTKVQMYFADASSISFNFATGVLLQQGNQFADMPSH